MSTIGRTPALASPAANATACDSQMPTSKKRSGNSSRIGSSMFPWHMAAVMTTTRGSARICSRMASRADGGIGRRAAVLRQRHHRAVSPCEGGRRVERRGVLGRPAGNRAPSPSPRAPAPGPWTSRAMARYFCNWRMLWPSTGPDVAEAQLLEEHAAQQAGLDRVLDLQQEPFHRVADHRHAVEQLLHLDLQPGVEVGHPQAVERFGQAAHPRADRHLVVVEHHDEVLLQPAGVVHGLQHDARAEGPVADDGHDVAVFAGPEQFVAALQAQGGGHAAAGMAGHEQVVGAFGRIGIAHQAALGPAWCGTRRSGR